MTPPRTSSAFPWNALAAILLALPCTVESFAPTAQPFVGAPISFPTPFGASRNPNQGIINNAVKLRKNNNRLYESPTTEQDVTTEKEDKIEEVVPRGGDPENNSDVRILSTADIPTLPPSAILNVFYAEQAIKALGTIGEVIEAYHTGFVFEIIDCKEDLGEVPTEFTIEWYALNFPFGAFLPDISEGNDGDESRIQWKNEAYCHYSPIYNPERWSKGRDLVGTIDGKTFSKFAEWVADYKNIHPGYDAFEVWDRPELEAGRTRRWEYSSTCSTFIEEGLRELYRLGGLRSSVTLERKEILKRSYVPLISRLKPSKVDMSNEEDVQEVIDFYVELNKAARGGEEEGLSTSNFVRLLADRLEVFYVYNTRDNEYTRVYLSAPYFALSNLYQPMSLPFQNVDLDGDGVLDDPGAFKDEQNDFIGELSAAAGGIADLLRRRLPPVLKRKFGPQILQLGLGVILLGTVVVSDESFLSGVLVGVAIGFAGSKLV